MNLVLSDIRPVAPCLTAHSRHPMMSKPMTILYEDEFILAIDKPAGFFVHPPERSPFPVPQEKICLHVLRRQQKAPVYPAHRLDAPTSGIVLFAKSREAAGELGRLFMERSLRKTYHAVARGFVESEGCIDLPLEIAGFAEPVTASTQYRKLQETELPHAVGKKYSTARYSLVEVEPVTGRWHQIRRHFDRIAHPLLGDIEHGDSHHNRFFRDHLRIEGLCLRACGLELVHPWTEKPLHLKAPVDAKWKSIYQLFHHPSEGLL